MSKTMKGILIDPFAKTVEWVSVEPGIDAIYALIQAQPFDIVRLPHNHSLFIDDEGLYRENQAYWQLPSFARPMAGRSLILGDTDDGDNKSCQYEIKRIRDAIVWRPNIEFDGLSAPSEHVDASGMVHIDMGKARFAPKKEEPEG